ncbi:YqaA family protein [Mannheimia varigena]|uniref:YqaA family protein n=1 Tax=Mannheimia varigena TaxID=85404 RepID=UPI0015B704DE|nr:VTT domain-containing protein [Mannheimia varigena]QLD33567.1 DedA family protein [Mannheimia varigena]
MTDYLTSLFSLFSSEQNQLMTMFFSGLLSSTLLPGNSEIIFTALASQHFVTNTTLTSSLTTLVIVATLGNSLGSLITYAMGLLVPHPKKSDSSYTQWALEKSKKYGILVLLFSWLPIVGDIFCGIAGWFRFNPWQSIILIIIGKLLRYLFLLATLYPVLKYVL